VETGLASAPDQPQTPLQARPPVEQVLDRGSEYRQPAPAAADRAIPGHWEGDLIIGTEGRSALITLVERKSRFLLISRIERPRHRDRDQPAHAMAESLPDRFATITWDQGVEMAGHAGFTVATGCPVFFARPPLAVATPDQREQQRLTATTTPRNTDFSLVPTPTSPPCRPAQPPTPQSLGLRHPS